MAAVPSLDSPASPRWRTHLPALAVFLVAVVVATVGYLQFRPVARQLWDNPLHDRNAHYWLSLSMGLDLRQGEFLHFLRDLDKTRVWGPLYPLLTGGVLAVGGPDYRLAVLTSLAAWCLTILFGFLAARRAVPSGGNLAGCVAALFILASPAHRAFSLDVMLESLGACLSLAALYYYLVLRQEEGGRAARALGLSLTLLFLLKYNYWLLVVLALAAAECLARPRAYLQLGRDMLTGTRRDFHLGAELRNPLSWGVVVALLLVGLLLVTGGSVVEIAGTRISVRSPDNLLWLAYLLAFLRGLQWWMRQGRDQVVQLDPRARQLIHWHLWPAALWMLWPKRLAHFFWYLTRDHGEGEASGGFLDGAAYYTGSLAEHYHQHLALFGIVLGLAALAFLCGRRLQAGGGALLTLTLIAGFLTIGHPTCRSRFLHSWIAVVWILAGVGLASLFALLHRLRPALRNGLALGVVTWLTCWQAPAALRLPVVPEGVESGIETDSPSTLLLADQYLGDLAGSDRVAILSNQPVKFFSWWTYLQKYRRPDRVESDLTKLGAPPESSPADTEAWVRRIKCDTIVMMEFDHPRAEGGEETEQRHESIRRCLTKQSVFLPVKHMRVPEHDCEIVILRRNAR